MGLLRWRLELRVTAARQIEGQDVAAVGGGELADQHFAVGGQLAAERTAAVDFQFEA